jgi:hypothetical protein
MGDKRVRCPCRLPGNASAPARIFGRTYCQCIEWSWFLDNKRGPGILPRAFYSPMYPASKAALNAITLAMMIELEPAGIKVNLVSPASPKRTSMDLRVRSRSKMAPERWCASHCSAQMVLMGPLHAGTMSRFPGDVYSSGLWGRSVIRMVGHISGLDCLQLLVYPVSLRRFRAHDLRVIPY